MLDKLIEAPMKPSLSKDVLDTSNFDPAFTGEEAIISVVAPKKVAQVNKQKDKFDNFWRSREKVDTRDGLPGADSVRKVETLSSVCNRRLSSWL